MSARKLWTVYADGKRVGDFLTHEGAVSAAKTLIAKRVGKLAKHKAVWVRGSVGRGE